MFCTKEWAEDIRIYIYIVMLCVCTAQYSTVFHPQLVSMNDGNVFFLCCNERITEPCMKLKNLTSSEKQWDLWVSRISGTCWTWRAALNWIVFKCGAFILLARATLVMHFIDKYLIMDAHTVRRENGVWCVLAIFCTGNYVFGQQQ